MMPPPVTRGLHSERGSAVLMVLLLLTLFLGVGFAYRQLMALEGRAVALQAHRHEALEAARAGLEVALSLLRSDDPSHDTLGEAWSNSPLLRGQLGAGVTYSVRSEDDLPDNGIFDLESRLALNRIPQPVLSRIPGVSQQVLPDIEAARKSAPIATLERFLRLARLDGKSFSRAAEAAPSQVLTVLGGDGALNVNTAGPAALRAMVGDEGLAQRLLDRRRGADGLDATADDQPWRSLEELRAQAGAEGLKVGSSLFSITVTAESRDGPFFARQRLWALVERSGSGLRVTSSTEL